MSEENTAFYLDRLRRYGPYDVRCLGWGSTLSQQARFHVIMSKIGNGEYVLDVGCGRGDLAERVGRLFYLGVDEISAMVKVAGERYPKHTFICGTIDAVSVNKFDWVVGSGIFHIDYSDWRERVGVMLRKMYGLSFMGVIVNFLVGASAGHSTSRKEIDSIARSICRKREYISGYLPNDITLVLRHGVRR